MPKIPAFCEDCGAIFASNYGIENAEGVMFVDSMGGSCPICGGTGMVPDGVYSAIDGTLEALATSQRSAKQLKRLATILRNAQKQGTTTEELEQEIESETPEFSGLAKWLPDSPSALYAFTTLLLYLLFNIADQGWKYLEYKQTQQQRRQIVREVVEQATAKDDEDIEQMVEEIMTAPLPAGEQVQNSGKEE